jgi:hypothetical protein
MLTAIGGAAPLVTTSLPDHLSFLDKRPVQLAIVISSIAVLHIGLPSVGRFVHRVALKPLHLIQRGVTILASPLSHALKALPPIAQTASVTAALAIAFFAVPPIKNGVRALFSGKDRFDRVTLILTRIASAVGRFVMPGKGLLPLAEKSVLETTVLTPVSETLFFHLLLERLGTAISSRISNTTKRAVVERVQLLSFSVLSGMTRVQFVPAVAQSVYTLVNFYPTSTTFGPVSALGARVTSQTIASYICHFFQAIFARGRS